MRRYVPFYYPGESFYAGEYLFDKGKSFKLE